MTHIQVRNFFIEYLRADHPDIYCKLDFINYPEIYKYGLIHGDMLSGKTDAILALSLYMAFSNVVPIVSVPKSGDIHQMKKSVNEFNKKWIGYLLKKIKHLDDDSEFKLNVLDAFDLEVDDKNNVKNASHFYKNFREKIVKVPSIIFTIHHTVQLGRLYQVVKRISEAKCAGPVRQYAMFFDECHRTLEPETNGVMIDEELPRIHETIFPSLNIGDSVVRLIKESRQIIGISATPFRSIFSDLYPLTYVIKCRPKNGNVLMGEYKGVSHLEYFHINELEKGVQPHEDPDLHRALKELSTISPLTSKVNVGLPKDQLPFIALIQVSRKKEDHEKVFDYITSNYPSQFSNIVFNSSTVKISLPNHVVNTIKHPIKYFNGTKITTCDISAEGIIYLDLNTPINSVLDVFVSIGIEKIERINIIAGDKLREGIRVNSSDYELAISGEFIRDESNMDNSTQRLRLVGYRRYTGTPKVWCTERFHSDVIKSFNLTHEIVDKLNKEYHFGDVNDSVTILKKTKISKLKLPKKKLSKAKMPMIKVNSIKDDFSLSAMEYIKQIKNTCMEELIKEDSKRKYNKGTKIHKFMEKTVIGKIYSKEELYRICEECGYYQPKSIISTFCKIDTKWSGGGTLEKIDENNYKRL